MQNFLIDEKYGYNKQLILGTRGSTQYEVIMTHLRVAAVRCFPFSFLLIIPQMVELQALERDEALLELKLRREWADDGLGGAVSRTGRSVGGTSNNNSSANPVVLE